MERWLAAPWKLTSHLCARSVPAGSMLLGTTVRPYGRNEYDLDSCVPDAPRNVAALLDIGNRDRGFD